MTLLFVAIIIVVVEIKSDLVPQEVKNQKTTFAINNFISAVQPEEITPIKPATISVKVIRGQRNQQLKISSILLFDSVQNFKDNVKNIKWLSNKRVRYPHLVYIPNATLADIEENFLDGFDIDNVAFLTNLTEISIELASSFMFTPKKCRSNQPKIINKFTGPDFKWVNTNSSGFYPQKYRNFHGCELMMAHDPTISYNPFYDNQTMFSVLYHELSSILNYTLNEYHIRIWHNFTNCTKCDVFKMTDFYFEHAKYITSDMIDIQFPVYILPPGESYTQFEKMLIVFDEGLWIAIIATFVIAFVSIQIINLLSRDTQDFVFGRDIRSPTLNILSIFLVGDQYRVPRRSFARFLLVLFVIWCLIIRTCYQSMMFKFLQQDVRRSQTITEEECDSLKILNITNDLDLASEPTNKMFSVRYKSQLQNEMEEMRRGSPSFVVLELTFQFRFCYIFLPFSPFYETLNEKISQANSNGRISRIREARFGRDEFWKKVEEIGPQVLTLEDLSAGFICFLVPLCISIIVFVLELVYFHVTNYLKRLIWSRVSVHPYPIEGI